MHNITHAMMERAAVELLERKMDRMTDAEILEKYGIVVEEEPVVDELIWDYEEDDWETTPVTRPACESIGYAPCEWRNA